MTAKEIQKRNEKAQHLRVIQVDDDNYYVESDEGKICYKVLFSDDGEHCTCGDYAKNVKKDPNFKCKHLLSVMNCIPTGEVESGEFLEKRKPRLEEDFITNIKGKDFVLYAGLLDLAHQKGLLKLECDLLQYPTKENGKEAVCRAVANGKTGEVFCDVGDANPTNVHTMISKHIIRMASTRAKARVMRDYTNIGMTCLEELGDLDEVIGAETAKKTTRKKAGSKTTTEAAKPKADKKQTTPKKDKPKTEPKKSAEGSTKPEAKEPDQTAESTAPKMSEAQKRAVYNLSRRRGISVEELENTVQEVYGTSLESLTSKDASAFIRQLQQAA